MLCTLLLNISYLVNEGQELPGHISLFKDKNTSLHNILAHFTHHAGNGSVWQHTLKEDGNFHRYWHPNTGKEHETFTDKFIPPFSEGRYFLAGLVHPLATLLPGRKHRTGLVPPTLVPTERHCSRGKERCHPSCGTLGIWKGLTHFHLWNGCCEDWVIQNRQSSWHRACPSIVAAIITRLAAATEQPCLMWEKTLPNKLLW